MKYLFLFLFILNAEAGFLPQAFKLNFKQSYKGLISGKEKVSNGFIEYQYPSRIHFKTTNPVQTVFMSNGKKSWYYRSPLIEGEKGEVTITNIDQENRSFPLTQVFDALKQGLKSNKLFKVIQQRGMLELIFNKNFTESTEVKKIYLKGSSFSSLLDIKEMVIDDGKRKKTLTFTRVKSLNTFPTGHFNFKVPASTNVTTSTNSF